MGQWRYPVMVPSYPYHQRYQWPILRKFGLREIQKTPSTGMIREQFQRKYNFSIVNIPYFQPLICKAGHKREQIIQVLTALAFVEARLRY